MQFNRTELHIPSLVLGVVVAIFSLVGFECAPMFGDEACNPLAGIPVPQAPLSLAAMVSFFTLCLSSINAGGRVMFAMGRHGLFHTSVGGAHLRNETRHVPCRPWPRSPSSCPTC